MYSGDLRKVAIKLYNKFHNFRYVSSLINVGKSTIHRWVNGISNKRIIDNHNFDLIIGHIKEIIDNDSFVTLLKIKESIKNKLGFQLSISYIHAIIKNTLKYSYKKITKRFIPKKSIRLADKQRAFKKTIKKINLNDVVCIDETGFYSNYVPNYGWAAIGQKCTRSIRTHPIKYSMVAAISSKKMVYYEIHKGNINKKIFIGFIEKLTQMVNNKHILMDNICFHKSKEILNLIQLNNKYLFIPPYSPWFNPIEEVFAFIKNKFKRSRLTNTIKRISSSINKIKCIYKYYLNSFRKDK
jgi:putative transposase